MHKAYAVEYGRTCNLPRRYFNILTGENMTIFQESYIVDVSNDGHLTPLGGKVCGWQIVEDGYATQDQIKDMKVGQTIELPFKPVGEYGVVKIERTK